MKNFASLSNINLEAIIVRTSTVVRRYNLLLNFNKVRQDITRLFVGNNNLRIWQTYDNYGNNYWHIYNPVTGNYNCVNSEIQMQAWIENHENPELTNN